jgi:hypothetical protein
MRKILDADRQNRRRPGRGELSAHAAMSEGGFRKRRTRALTLLAELAQEGPDDSPG